MRVTRSLGACLLIGLVGLMIWAVQSTPRGATFYRNLTSTVRFTTGTTFAPAPGARPALSANAAYGRITGKPLDEADPRSALFVFPGLVSIQTASRRLGPQNELAWGYATPALCSPRSFPAGRSPPPPKPCTFWLFADANTGRWIDVQPVASAGWPAGVTP
jgi:hypothetical protein